jgi:hypothetical protein
MNWPGRTTAGKVKESKAADGSDRGANEKNGHTGLFFGSQRFI